jgi:glycosyltransferase involved in cell wall biosynthesis
VKILVFNWRDIRHPEAGGAEAYVHEIGSLWAAQGHDVVLISGHPTHELRSERTEEGLKLVRVGDRYRVYPAAVMEYRRRWRGWPDVVVEHVNGVPFFTPWFVEEPLVAVVHHMAGRIFFRELPFPLALIGYSLERTLPLVYRPVPIVAVSRSTREELIRRGLSPRQLHVIHNGLHAPLDEPSVERAENLVLYLGRLKKYKRLDLWVAAAKQVARAVPDVAFLVAGRGDYEDELRALIRKQGLESCVRLLGFVTEKEKTELLRRCKLLVVASEKEGWGVTILEAANHGTPCVAFDVPGVRDAIVEGETGLLVPNGNPGALAQATVELLADEAKRRRLAEGAIRHARGFRWEASANEFLSLLKDVVRLPSAVEG